MHESSSLFCKYMSNISTTQCRNNVVVRWKNSITLQENSAQLRKNYYSFTMETLEAPLEEKTGFFAHYLSIN